MSHLHGEYHIHVLWFSAQEMLMGAVWWSSEGVLASV